MEQYGSQSQMLQSKNSGILKFGYYFSIISIIASFVLIVCTIIFANSENSHIIYSGMSIIVSIFYACVLFAFIMYLHSLQAHMIKIIAIVNAIFFVMILAFDIAYLFMHPMMLEKDVSEYLSFVTTFNMVFNIFLYIYWLVNLTYGIIMMSSKIGYVEGIQKLGIAVIVTTALATVLYLSRESVIDFLLSRMDISIEGMVFIYLIQTVIGVLLNIVVLSVYMYVFKKAIQKTVTT